MQEGIKILPIKLANDIIIHIETQENEKGQRQNVVNKAYTFDKVKEQIGAFSEELHKSLVAIKPSSLKIEFGCELTLEAGNVIALITKGSVKSNLKITLEWSDPK